MISARLVDHVTGETLAETELDPKELPPSFARAEAVLEVGGNQWTIVAAEPDGRDAIARAGEVVLRLVRAEAPLTHEEATRDDRLPEMVEARRDEGLTLRPGDWRQVELVAAALRAEIDEELTAIRAVLASGKPGAYPRCHVRGRLESPLSGQHIARAEVARALGGEDPRALALRGHPGVVRGGFAMPLGDSIAYGTVLGDEGDEGDKSDKSSSVRVIGLAGYPLAVAPRLAGLARKHALVLVDWRAAKLWTTRTPVKGQDGEEDIGEGFVEA